MADLNLPTPNKDPGDGAPADDINLVIEAVNTLNSAVENIAAGPQGPQGEPGTPGTNGQAATVSVASTVTTTPGGDAQVVEGGTAQNRTLTFYIPRGEQGPAGSTGATGAQGPSGDPGVPAAISIGTVTTGAPESNATVTNSGSTSNVVLDFSIPRGPTGEAANLGDNTPQDLGTAAAGVSTGASRQDHVHNMPSAADVGADPAGSASAAQTAAESYADSLASNYDSAGSAAAVASDLSDHELASTTVHGISNTANLVYTDDSRLSDARTPTAHATSHESGGSDELTLAQSQVTNLTSDLSAKALATDLTDHENATTSVHGITNTANLMYTGDAPTAHAASHASGGGDAITIAQSQVTDLTTDLAAKIAKSIVDAKGDLIVATASDTVSRVAVGTDGQALIADSGETAGVRWGTVATDPTPTALFLGGM